MKSRDGGDDGENIQAWVIVGRSQTLPSAPYWYAWVVTATLTELCDISGSQKGGKNNPFGGEIEGSDWPRSRAFRKLKGLSGFLGAKMANEFRVFTTL